MADAGDRSIQTPAEPEAMTGMLASVSTLAEAQLALKAKVDILDLKQPDQGTLGALDVKTVREIVLLVDGRIPVSATVGDLVMQPEIVTMAVQAMADTGVDYIKIGFFPGGDWTGSIASLGKLAARGLPLIAVLFADAEPDLAIVSALARAGFTGVMLDTMDKRRGSLSSVLDREELAAFIDAAKTLRLLTGLAGSLRLQDIPGLLPLQPDYLGFRGALCRQHERTARLEPAALDQIRQAIANHSAHRDHHAQETLRYL